MILGNLIDSADYCGIAAGDVDGLKVADNRLVRCNREPWLPTTENETTSGIDYNYGIVLQNCAAVTLTSNAIMEAGAGMKAPVSPVRE